MNSQPLQEPESKRIDITSARDMQRWMDELKVTRAELEAAIKIHGTRVEDVKRCLGK